MRMAARSLTDSLRFELSGSERPKLSRLLWRTVVINQLIALPVALVMTAVDSGLVEKLMIATIYSQTIGILCTLASWATLEWLDRFTGGMRRSVLTAQYFFCGALGAEIARRLCPMVFGRTFDSGPPIVSWAIGATIALIVGFVLMTVRHLRERVVSTELEALQARINPHFLFNTLNSIAALIREDPPRAEAMTLRLSALFRYTLEAPRRGLVTLEEESSIVDGYLAIEQERLAERLTYTVDIDDTLLMLRLPPLTLQPLAENAIKHGIADSVNGGKIVVRGWRDGSIVHLTVENTTEGDRHHPGTGEGLDNVRRRLRATFGREAGVTLHQSSGKTTAHLSLPMRGRT